jgi:Helix-turn-helix domain
MGRATRLTEVPASLWGHPSMVAALVDRDIGAVLRLVRDHVGWSQSVIAAKIDVSQSQVSPIVRGSCTVTSLSRMESVADGLGMTDQARMILGLAPRWASADAEVPGGSSGCSCSNAGGDGSSCAMHRRQFLGAVGTAVGGVALRDPEHIADLVRRRAASNVDDLTLDDMEVTVDHLVQQIAVQPHHELYPLAARNWGAAERLMDGWQSLSHRRRLVDLASQLAFYTGELHFSAGRYPAALQFARLTHRYAAEIKNPVLRHAAVILQSSVAFHGGNYHRCAEIVERGARYETDYTRARGFGCAARAYGALGDQGAATQALASMMSSMVDSPRRPGHPPFTHTNSLTSTATSLRLLGDHTGSTVAARDALSAFEGDSSPDRRVRAHAQVTLALALTMGDHPDPDEAVDLGAGLLDSPEHLIGTQVKRLTDLRLALRPWSRTPRVAILTDRITAQERLHLA